MPKRSRQLPDLPTVPEPLLLANADPIYIARVKKGASWLRAMVLILITMLLLYVVGLIAFAIALALGSPQLGSKLQGGVTDPPLAISLISWVVGLVFLWFFATGLWNVSAELPGFPQSDQPAKRRSVRDYLKVYLLCYALQLVIGALLSVPMSPAAADSIVIANTLLGLATSVVSILIYFASGRLVESLAARAEDAETLSTAQSFRKLLKYAIIAAIATGIGIAAGSMLLSLVPAFGGAAMMIIGVVGMVAFIVFAIGAVGRFCSMWLKLHQALKAIHPA